MVAFFFCGPDEINEQIKKTENKLTVLREELKLHEKELVTLHKQLNFYENKWPTLEESKPGDRLKDGCIVVNKFSDTRMALIAAPQSSGVLISVTNMLLKVLVYLYRVTLKMKSHTTIR
jgi:hypothetical protein